jgi:hypothetical protein
MQLSRVITEALRNNRDYPLGEVLDFVAQSNGIKREEVNRAYFAMQTGDVLGIGSPDYGAPGMEEFPRIARDRVIAFFKANGNKPAKRGDIRKNALTGEKDHPFNIGFAISPVINAMIDANFMEEVKVDDGRPLVHIAPVVFAAITKNAGEHSADELKVLAELEQEAPKLKEENEEENEESGDK